MLVRLTFIYLGGEGGANAPNNIKAICFLHMTGQRFVGFLDAELCSNVPSDIKQWLPGIQRIEVYTF